MPSVRLVEKPHCLVSLKQKIYTQERGHKDQLPGSIFQYLLPVYYCMKKMTSKNLPTITYAAMT